MAHATCGNSEEDSREKSPKASLNFVSLGRNGYFNTAFKEVNVENQPG